MGASISENAKKLLRKKTNDNKLYIVPQRFDEEIERNKGILHSEKTNEKGDPARLWICRDIAYALGYHETRLSYVRKGRKGGYPTSLELLQGLGELWGINWKWLCGKSEDRTEADIERRFKGREYMRLHQMHIIEKVLETLGYTVTCEGDRVWITRLYGWDALDPSIHFTKQKKYEISLQEYRHMINHLLTTIGNTLEAYFLLECLRSEK